MTTAINTAPLPAPGAIDDFRVLPLKTLKLSKTNPRKHIDPKKQKELESSIQAKGVIVPILVRPIPDGDPDAVEQFEVVAGERRYRAAKTAKLDHVPCQIRAMLDEEALEIQVIENDQREDVHPLEQAEGYLQLQKKNDLTPEQIAAKVGKDVSWVYKRIRLTALIEPAKKAYYADQLTLGHAELIARLQPEDQKLALKFTLQFWPDFDGEHAPDNEVNPDAGDFLNTAIIGEARTACSVRDLRDFIQQRLMLNLVNAEFDPSDAQLVAKAGACETCPKRSGFAQELFGDIAKTRDICLDRVCYAGKQNAHVEALKAKLKQGRTKFIELTADQSRPAGYPNAVKEGSSTIKIITGKPCKFVRVGIYIDGVNKGKVVQVCNERVKCRKHWQAGQDKKRRFDEAAGLQEPHPSMKDPTPKQIAKQQEAGRLETIYTEVTDELMDQLPGLVAQKIKGEFTGPDLDLLMLAVGNSLDTLRLLKLKGKPQKLSQKDKIRAINMGLFVERIDNMDDAVNIIAHAKRLGVDVDAEEKKIRAEVEERYPPVAGPAEKEEKPKAVKKSAKPAAKKSSKKKAKK